MNLCIFAGSSAGIDPAHRAAACAVGTLLARRGIGIVYGGGRVGLMGALADAALAAGGHVIGVIPTRLVEMEVAHRGLPELYEVASMHDRKALMADLSTGFLALPGGIGTLEELFEVWTWNQIGFHSKPCALLNVAGYYEPLLAFLGGAVTAGFVSEHSRDRLLTGTDPQVLIDALLAANPDPSPEWIDRDAI